LLRLVTNLDRRRFAPVVWVAGDAEQGGSLLARAAIPVHAMALDARDSEALEAALCWMRSLGASVFHSFGYGDEWLDLVLARMAGIPVCISRRGNLRHWDPQGFPEFPENLRNVASDVVVANSQAVASFCADAERIPARKIRVIYNGVEAPGAVNRLQARQSLGFSSDDLVVANVAHLRPVKGQQELLQAFRHVAATVPNAKLLICGEGDARPLLEQLRDELGLPNHVVFTGFRQDVDTIYAASDLYVNASRSEGFSNSILEAMHAGLAVVATSVGGTPESVIDGETGVLTPPGDAGKLAEAIIRLLEDETLRRRLGERGRACARERFTVSRMVGDYEQLYDAELRRRGMS
jgi:glycosyltransferase involved in cell wall biosynthesis